MTVRKKLFYQISTSGRTADINIYGDITGNAELINARMDTDTGAVSARSIVQEIQELDVDTINVYINSYGGEVAEALAIYSALKRHSASVHTFCDGFACSAATIIFCAGDVRTMGSIALLMIHNCTSYLGYANSNEMRKAAEDNDKINQSSINAYMAVVNISQDKVQEMMDNATWLTAQECLEYGFATEIADQETDPEHPEQSAFGVIREAVLTTHGTAAGPVVNLNEVMQKLAELGTKIDAMQKPEAQDPGEDPEENVPENTARARAVRFFSFLTKED